jgi:hypothetical protein
MCVLPDPLPALLPAGPSQAPLAWVLFGFAPLGYAQRYVSRVRKFPPGRERWRIAGLHLADVLCGLGCAFLLLDLAFPWSAAVDAWHANIVLTLPTTCSVNLVEATHDHAQTLVVLLILGALACFLLGAMIAHVAERRYRKFLEQGRSPGP